MTPQIVLTDQKAKMIVDRPFSIAYKIFEDRLRSSDFWFIGGYAFGDEPVNAALRRAYQEAHVRGRQPRILIADPDPSTCNKASQIFPPINEWQDSFEYCDALFPWVVDSFTFTEFFGYYQRPF